MWSAWATRRRAATNRPFVGDRLSARGSIGALIWCMLRCSRSRCLRSLLGLLVGIALLLSACSSSDGEASPTRRSDPSGSTTAVAAVSSTPTTGPVSTTSPVTTGAPSTTTATSSTAELTSAIRAFWDLYLSVGARTGPFDGEATRARLAERTTGASLNRLLAYFSSNAASGYLVRGAIEIAPTIVSVSGDTAQVRDCYDDTTGLYRMSDGTRVDTDNPLRHQVLMTLVRENGVWKVSAITDEGDGCTASQ